MRRLAQPSVLKSAALGALLTTLACYPRFTVWKTQLPIWYLLVMLFVSAFVLWAFVFAWHTAYVQRPVFVVKFETRSWLLATGAALIVASVLHFVLDPVFKLRTPGDYPTSVAEWFGMTLFALAFGPLWLTFAPLAWAARLFQRVWLAAVFTICFDVFVMIVKTQSAPTPVPLPVFVQLLALRLVLGAGSVYFYLRGGAWLVWWWLALVQLRHLANL